MFETFGPFQLKTHDPKGIDDLFAAMKQANKKLESAIGVYIFVGLSSDGKPIPIYVGQTYRSFGKRLIEHFEAHKFSQHMENAKCISLFLIARVTAKQRFRLSTAKIRSDRGLKSIDWLEVQMIDHCLKLNPFLLNISEKTFQNGLKVPGFRDGGAAERKPAAKALSKVLKIK
jgi:hypothetical protein